MSLVSLMMPAYNTARFLEQAVDSVKSQTYANWELIIVDDGSTDGTWDLASKAASADHRIKAYRNDENLGIARTRFTAASHAAGEFIGHIDSDDILVTTALEEMVSAFQRDPDVMLLYSDMNQIGPNGEFQFYGQSPDFNQGALHQHGWRHFGMYRRDVLKRIHGYNINLRGCEDGDLFMQIAEKFKCARVPKVLYHYRYHGGNFTSKIKGCAQCPDRIICNYVRVWCRSAGYDPVTFKKIGN